MILQLENKSGGEIGIGYKHLESGDTFFYKGDTLFPMASTLKIPAAVQLLKRVDNGEVSLSEMIEIRKSDLHPGSGTIVRNFEDLGVSLSLKNLLVLMLIESDNSAADLCIKYAGGTKAINKRLKEIGIKDMSVDRPTYVAISQFLGVKNITEKDEYNDDYVISELRKLSNEERQKAAGDFFKDIKDYSSPIAMTDLLDKIWSSNILSKENSKLLLEILKDCKTGTSRIRGLLPKETAVYHKTGTIGNVTNDVGIVELPSDFGNIIVCIFIKNAKLDTKKSEEIIAEISRLLYDYSILSYVPE
jgi:beta-lactamase class A